MTIPEIDFPSSDSDFIKDPYPFMKELREKSPVVLDKTTNLQLVTRFDGVNSCIGAVQSQDLYYGKHYAVAMHVSYE